MGIYTKEEQFELIRENTNNLKNIENQYQEVCLEAVRRNGIAIEYVKKQTDELCLEAIKKDGRLIKKVRRKTPKLCFYAFLNRNDLNVYGYVKKGINNYIKKNTTFTKTIFCFNYFVYIDLNRKNINDYEVVNLDIKSFINLQDILIENSCDNYFVFTNKARTPLTSVRG